MKKMMIIRKKKDDPYRKLAKHLKTIWDDKDFFMGIMTAVPTRRLCKKLLRFLETTPDATAENVMVYALSISDNPLSKLKTIIRNWYQK